MTLMHVKQMRVSSESFGKHICGMTNHLGYPLTPYHRLGGDSIRLWDCGVNWRTLEPTTKGVFDWSRMDLLMSKVQAGGAKNIMYCLGQAPNWATDTPGYSTSYNPNKPRNTSDMLDFLASLLERYPAINEIQVWNEPNSTDYWTGTVQELVDITIAVSEKCRSINPNIKVISACPDSYEYRGAYLESYLSALAGAPGGLGSIDVVDFHVYVQPKEPEYMLMLTRLLKGIVQKNGFSGIPVFITEFGWGTYTDGGVTQVPGDGVVMPDSLAKSYILRSYVSLLSEVDRAYFYAVDKFNFSKLLLISPTDKSVETVAGAALVSLSNVLSGGSLSGLVQHGNTYRVGFVDKNFNTGEIVWSTDGNSFLTNLAGYRLVTNVDGSTYTSSSSSEMLICWKKRG